MSEPAGQTRSEIPATQPGADPVVVLSAARDVEQGARSMLLLVEGLFRLDVIPHDDMVQTIVRNLSAAARAELRFRPVGGAASVLGGPGEIAIGSTGRFGGDVVLVEDDGREQAVARVLVGSVCHPERGLTSFTAQATLGKTGA